MQKKSIFIIYVAFFAAAGCKSLELSRPTAINTADSSYFVVNEGGTSYFKVAPVNASELGDKVCNLEPGKKYTYSGNADKTLGHYRFSVTNAEFGCKFRTGYVFAEHITIGGKSSSSVDSDERKSSQGKRLSVPYFCQMKNLPIRRSGSCSNSVLAMVIAHHGKKSISPHGTLPDQLWDRFGQLNSADKIRQAALKLGFQASTYLPGTMDQIKQEIDEGRPVIVGADFVGKVGHFIIVTGYDKSGVFVNDPYGHWDQQTVSPGDGYGAKLCHNGYSGEGLHYTYSAMKRAAGKLGLYLVLVR